MRGRREREQIVTDAPTHPCANALAHATESTETRPFARTHAPTEARNALTQANKNTFNTCAGAHLSAVPPPPPRG